MSLSAAGSVPKLCRSTRRLTKAEPLEEIADRVGPEGVRPISLPAQGAFSVSMLLASPPVSCLRVIFLAAYIKGHADPAAHSMK
jgi:hypothetical protein